MFLKLCNKKWRWEAPESFGSNFLIVIGRDGIVVMSNPGCFRIFEFCRCNKKQHQYGYDCWELWNQMDVVNQLCRNR